MTLSRSTSLSRLRFTASDEYGLTKLTFHFESDPSNADVKNFPVPPATTSTVKDTEFVPKDLGARPGDTVSYYLQAFDNRADRPNVSRTPTYTFKVADSRTSLDLRQTCIAAARCPPYLPHAPG